MGKQIFVNLPVKDLDRSKTFFGGLGYTFDPQFTDDKAACMVVSDGIYVMLLKEDFFGQFTKKKIADAHATTEVLVALSEDSKKAVDDRVDKALELGATEARAPQDHGFMYGRSFSDSDGHIWEVMWMDMTAMQQ